jgi:inositol transport system permease protein
MILQVSVVGIIAIGVTQVIITGGIDLSSGSVVGATAMIAMSFAQVSTYPRAVFPGLTDLPVVVPIAIGLGCGLLAGLINGLLIAYTRIPPFIATLGMMVTARGIAKWYTKGQPVSFPTDSYAAIGAGMTPVLIFIAMAILFQLILRYTIYGRHTYAIGSNEQAARVSGINVERHLILVYVIAGGRAWLHRWHDARHADFRRHHFGFHLPAHRCLLSGDAQGPDHRRCCRARRLSPTLSRQELT